MGVFVYGCMCACVWVYVCMGVFVYVCMCAWVYACMDVCVYWCTGVWMHECMDGCMCVFVYGCAGVWVHGRMKVCVRLARPTLCLGCVGFFWPLPLCFACALVYVCVLCMCVWVYGCMSVWVNGCMGVWMYGCAGVCVYRCMGACVYVCMGVFVYGCIVYGRMKVCVRLARRTLCLGCAGFFWSLPLFFACALVHGCMYVCVLCMCAWVYGCMSVWVNGCMGVWMYE